MIWERHYTTKQLRGITLSAEAQAQLQSWYNEQEAAMFVTAPEVTGIAKLQAQIDVTLTQLMSMTRRI